MPKPWKKLQNLLDEGREQARFLPVAASYQEKETLLPSLKLLNALHPKHGLSAKELDALSQEEIKLAFEAHERRRRKRARGLERPKTATEFFHSIIHQSPYALEIIAHTKDFGGAYTSPNQEQSTSLSSRKEPPTAERAQQKTKSVHGFNLSEQEALSATRYFSEDKKSFARIIAQGSKFTAQHENLSPEQEADLALEMAFQYLLNLPPDQNHVYIKGKPEMAHRLYAAFLYLKKESAENSRFAGLTIHLPDGLSGTPGFFQSTDKYIKKHLGTPEQPPQQITQWRDYLNLTQQANPDSAKEEVIFDFRRIFHAPELSKEEKNALNQYQKYVRAHKADVQLMLMTDTDTKTHLSLGEEFIVRTKEALYILKKAPSLQHEFEVLKNMYQGALEGHQQLIEKAQATERVRDTGMREILSQLQSAKQYVLIDSLGIIKKRINDIKHMGIPPLSEEQLVEAAAHQAKLENLLQSIKDDETLSKEEMQPFGQPLIDALSFLERIEPEKNRSRSTSEASQFDVMRDFAEELAEPSSQDECSKTQVLADASRGIKAHLREFKRVFQGAQESEFVLDDEAKARLKEAIEATKECSPNITAAGAKTALTELTEKMQALYSTSATNKADIEALHEQIDKVLPFVQEQTELAQALSDIKSNIGVPPALEIVSPERDIPQKPIDFMSQQR